MIPGFLCITGYAAYLRISWFIVIPALIGTSFILVLIVRGIRSTLKGRSNDVCKARDDKILALSFLGIALASWYSGTQIRRLQCEARCARAEPALQELQTYKDRRGSYPAELSEVPAIESLARTEGITIRQGRIGRAGIDVEHLEEADITIYLQRDGYLCVAPLERKLPMSITRFYILRKDSGSPDWIQDHLIWFLTGLF